jgi:hypothetical protein
MGMGEWRFIPSPMDEGEYSASHSGRLTPGEESLVSIADEAYWSLIGFDDVLKKNVKLSL